MIVETNSAITTLPMIVRRQQKLFRITKCSDFFFFKVIFPYVARQKVVTKENTPEPGKGRIEHYE